jgi:hypothetical protein
VPAAVRRVIGYRPYRRASPAGACIVGKVAFAPTGRVRRDRHGMVERPLSPTWTSGGWSSPGNTGICRSRRTRDRSRRRDRRLPERFSPIPRNRETPRPCGWASGAYVPAICRPATNPSASAGAHRSRPATVDRPSRDQHPHRQPIVAVGNVMAVGDHLKSLNTPGRSPR